MNKNPFFPGWVYHAVKWAIRKRGPFLAVMGQWKDFAATDPKLNARQYCIIMVGTKLLLVYYFYSFMVILPE